MSGVRGWLNDELEPSRVRAVIVAVVSLAAALGLVATTDLPGWVDPMLAGWAVAAPWIQHRLVRPKVIPVAKVEAAIADSPSIGLWAQSELEGNLGIEQTHSDYGPGRSE